MIGVVSDHFGRITTACGITIFNSILAFAFWIPVTTYAPLIALAIIYGATCGVFWAVSRPQFGGRKASADTSRQLHRYPQRLSL